MTRRLIFSLLIWQLSIGPFVSGEPWEPERPIVDLGQGRVIGVEERANNFTYYAFRGMPYAQPPLGDLRFKDPVTSEIWEGDLDGAALPLPCTQRGLKKSGEDCLYVSVYTPKDALPVKEEPLAVLVFIHGGFFVYGSMSTADTCHPLLEKDVIVVSLQYRLGVLGFFSTEDPSAPGNLGLKDQTLALQWIKEHIAPFGGDPDRITIFGESAGSLSVHYQLLAPSAKGLFRGAIMQSGTALCPGAHGRNFLDNARVIANEFGCPQSPSEDLVTCLQEIPAHAISEMNYYFEEWNGHPRNFAPRVDGSYIPDEPLNLLKEGRYNQVPVIMGTNKDEGAIYSLNWYAFPSIRESLVDNFTVNGPISLELLPEEEPSLTANEVYDYYLPGLIIGKDQADNATMLNGYRYCQIPVDWTVGLMAPGLMAPGLMAPGLMAPGLPLFLYELQHRGQHGLTDAYFMAGLDLPQAANWVSHSDDLQYFFDKTLERLKTPEDLAVRDLFVTTWTNFAKTLDPTPDESLGMKWNKVEGADMMHLTIVPSPYMEKDHRSGDREFWNSLPLKDNPFNKH